MKRVLVITIALLVLFCTALPVSAAQSSGVVSEETFTEVLELIRKHHIDNPSDSSLYEGALLGIIEALNDPYTRYLTPAEMESEMSYFENQYIGVGIQLSFDGDYPMIINVFPDSPAAEAGILTTDLIVKIGSQDIARLAMDEVMSKLGGPEGSKLNLTIRREGVEDFAVELVRSLIILSPVSAQVLDDNIGYIALNLFSLGSGEKFTQAAWELKEQGVTGLIVDLRDNPGGSLMDALEMVGVFVGEGKVAGYFLFNDGRREPFRTIGTPKKLDLPTVVLINKGSASASEFLAGALQDFQIAQVVGATTMGKGTAQDVYQLKNGAGLFLTEAQFFTPKNRPINGVGIKPDYQVLIPDLQGFCAMRVLNPPSEYKVVFDLNEPQAAIDDIWIPLEVGASQEEGVFDLPVRFLFEALGFKVDRQNVGNSVRIIGNGYDKVLCPIEGHVHGEPEDYEVDDWYIDVDQLAQFGLSYSLVGDTIEIKVTEVLN